VQGLVKSGEAEGSPFQACIEGLEIALFDFHSGQGNLEIALSRMEVKECRAVEKLRLCRQLRRSLSGTHAPVRLL